MKKKKTPQPQTKIQTKAFFSANTDHSLKMKEASTEKKTTATARPNSRKLSVNQKSANINSNFMPESFSVERISIISSQKTEITKGARSELPQTLGKQRILVKTATSRQSVTGLSDLKGNMLPKKRVVVKALPSAVITQKLTRLSEENHNPVPVDVVMEKKGNLQSLEHTCSKLDVDSGSPVPYIFHLDSSDNIRPVNKANSVSNDVPQAILSTTITHLAEVSQSEYIPNSLTTELPTHLKSAVASNSFDSNQLKEDSLDKSSILLKTQTLEDVVGTDTPQKTEANQLLFSHNGSLNSLDAKDVEQELSTVHKIKNSLSSVDVSSTRLTNKKTSVRTIKQLKPSSKTSASIRRVQPTDSKITQSTSVILNNLNRTSTDTDSLKKPLQNEPSSLVAPVQIAQSVLSDLESKTPDKSVSDEMSVFRTPSIIQATDSKGIQKKLGVTKRLSGGSSAAPRTEMLKFAQSKGHRGLRSDMKKTQPKLWMRKPNQSSAEYDENNEKQDSLLLIESQREKCSKQAIVHDESCISTHSPLSKPVLDHAQVTSHEPLVSVAEKTGTSNLNLQSLPKLFANTQYSNRQYHVKKEHDVVDFGELFPVQEVAVENMRFAGQFGKNEPYSSVNHGSCKQLLQPVSKTSLLWISKDASGNFSRSFVGTSNCTDSVHNGIWQFQNIHQQPAMAHVPGDTIEAQQRLLSKNNESTQYQPLIHNKSLLKNEDADQRGINPTEIYNFSNFEWPDLDNSLSVDRTQKQIKTHALCGILPARWLGNCEFQEKSCSCGTKVGDSVTDTTPEPSIDQNVCDLARVTERKKTMKDVENEASILYTSTGPIVVKAHQPILTYNCEKQNYLTYLAVQAAGIRAQTERLEELRRNAKHKRLPTAGSKKEQQCAQKLIF